MEQEQNPEDDPAEGQEKPYGQTFGSVVTPLAALYLFLCVLFFFFTRS